MPRWRERRFAHRLTSVAEARRFVADVLSVWGLADGDAVLAVSELATNAVRHAGTEFAVRVIREVGQVRVEVANGSPVLPSLPGPSTDREAGRGVQLVEAVATAWGVLPSSGGKAVWFTVPARGGGPASGR